MTSERISSHLARCGLLCLFVQALYSGSAGRLIVAAQEPAPAATASQQGAVPPRSQSTEPVVIPMDAAVLTITGLCDNSNADKTAPSKCATVITRADFEKLVAAIQPNMTAHARREFALNYANALVMARKAEQMGLDKGSLFDEQMRVARIDILSKELKKMMQKEASQISDSEINRYYDDNTASFEEAEMERIYVPRTQDVQAAPEKTAAEAGKPKELKPFDTSMKEFAGKLRERAVAGEDFSKLQAEAYQATGIKAAPNPSLGKIRRISLPRVQVSVMDLKPGEVSPVIEALNGYLIYKIKEKETLTLEQSREEIKGILRSQRLQEETKSIEESATSTLNENYFRRQGPPPTGNKPPAKPDAQ